MKQAFFAVLLLVCASARADVVQEQKTLADQFTADKTEYASLDTQRASLAKRYDDLKWTQEQIVKQVDKFKADRANLTMQMDQQQAVIDNHNARCSGTFSDAGYVNSCNSEANQIDATSAQLNQANQALEQNRSLIQQAIQTQSEETEKVVAADKAAMDRQNELAVDEQRILDRLHVIAGQVKNCQDAIALVDANPTSDYYKENMHSVCGSSFDGNK